MCLVFVYLLMMEDTKKIKLHVLGIVCSLILVDCVSTDDGEDYTSSEEEDVPEAVPAPVPAAVAVNGMCCRCY